MTLLELEAEVSTRETDGRDRIVLMLQRKREPKGEHVRVLPGVLGRFVGFDAGRLFVDVAVADLRRYLKRALAWGHQGER